MQDAYAAQISQSLSSLVKAVEQMNVFLQSIDKSLADIKNQPRPK